MSKEKKAPEKRSPKQEAIRSMLNFTNLINIHSSKNKYLCGITLEFKDKKFNNKARATIDMSNDSEFGDILSGDVADYIREFYEKAALVEIDEQRSIRIEQERITEEVSSDDIS